MSLISITNTFSAGAVIVASQHNANFSVIYSDYNGNIDNTNISPGAVIAYSKLNLATSIVNADINASAAIVDTKLAQITTASKVHGTAITGLASLPAGAGVIPSANLPTITAPALVFVSATSIAAATNSGDITIDATKWYVVDVILTVTSAATDSLALRFNNDSTATNYGYVRRGWNISATGINANSTSAAFILLTDTISAATPTPFTVRFFISPQGTTGGKVASIKGESFGNNGSTYSYSDVYGVWNNSATATSFRLLTSGGAVTMTGTVYLYNITTS